MLACSRCACQLRVVTYRHAAAYRCPRCHGHAVTYPVIRDVLERGRWQRLWRRVSAGGAPGEGEAAARMRCPGCGKAMAEVRDEGLVIDSCRTCHLLWFDRGELGALPAKPVSRAAVLEAEARAAALERRAPRAGQGLAGTDAPEDTWQRICGWIGLPFEVDQAAPRRAYVTAALAITFVLTFLLAYRSGLYSAVEEWGFVPSRLGRHGGATWITSFFLHGDWLHLFSNAYFLVAFGDNVEEDLGGARYVLLLFLGAILGCALHAAFDPRSAAPLVGASAGISAALLYYAFRFPKARIGWALRFGFIPIWWFRMTARTAFALWLALQLVLAGFQRVGLTNVSAAGHLGGVAAGVLFVLVQRALAEGERYGPR